MITKSAIIYSIVMFVALIVALVVFQIPWISQTSMVTAERYYIKQGMMYRASSGDDLEDIIERQMNVMNIDPELKLKEIYPELAKEQHFFKAEQMEKAGDDQAQKVINCFKKLGNSPVVLNLFTSTIEEIVYMKFSSYEVEHEIQVSDDQVKEFINQLKPLALNVAKCSNESG